MEYKNLLISSHGAITTITLNNPEKLNALDLETIDSLDASISSLASQDSCKVIIITGSGDKAFCAGADIKYLNKIEGKSGADAFADKMHNMLDKIEMISKPTIAAINGYCIGGGLELALGCDIRIATSDSKFAQPEVKIGIIPGGGGTYRLPKAVGTSNAREMIFTGETIGAQDAYRIMLISKITEKNQLLAEANSIALKIAENSTNALKLAKSTINSNSKSNGDIEKKAFASCFSHPDASEGIGAFLDKRKPKFM